MPERLIRIGELELWTEDFGDPADPAVLLNSGGGAPGILWSESFCGALADAGRHVIRYDYRDVGLSSVVDFGANPYTISDLVTDAISVLDAYDAGAAHLVGWSQGGVIAQTAALEHPDRVASVVSIASTPLRGAFHSGGDGALGGPEPEFAEAGLAMIGAQDDEERLDRYVDFMRVGCGTSFDEEQTRAFGAWALRRGRGPEGVMNHVMAMAATPECRDELRRITAPTLVIHGTHDRVIPMPHGEATAAAIPGARLLVIEGMGHIPRPEPKEMLAAIVEHTVSVGAKR